MSAPDPRVICFPKIQLASTGASTHVHVLGIKHAAGGCACCMYKPACRIDTDMGLHAEVRLVALLTQVRSSERLTGALLERLTHHFNMLSMNGDSYRLKQSAGRRRSAKSE